MTNNLKPGDKFLLPVTFNENDDGAFEFENEFGAYIWLRHEGVNTLIPASTLTDLQAENAKLRTALKVIRDMLDSPDPRRHRDITPELIYRTAVKALGGE